MSKNAYAQQLQLKKALERQDLIKRTAQTCLDIMTIALNDEFRFGPERLERLAKRFNDFFTEYDDMLEDGVDYADGKLKDRIDQIMGRQKNAG